MTTYKQNFNESYANNNGVKIFYRDYGPIDGIPILLVQGLGGQLSFWPPHLLAFLAENGFRPIVYDNRDVGLSSRFYNKSFTFLNYLKYYLRLPINSEYLIDDMADDGISVLDALDIDRAHVLGISMGGMIGQIITSKFPERVITYTQLASTILTPSPLNGPSMTIRKLVLKRSMNPNATIEEKLERALRIYSELSIFDYDYLKTEVAEFFLANIKRGGDDNGFGRQVTAILATRDRIQKVRKINRPTLIIHGDEDPMIKVRNAYIAHKNIPNSKLVIVKGMKHLIEEPVFQEFKEDLYKHLTNNNANN